MTDIELIEAAKKGDSNAFKDLVRRHEGKVAATVIGMLGNGPEADDVGQEVFIRFYKNLNQFKGDSTLGTYLTRIAINLSLNAIKRKKRHHFISLNWKDNEPMELPDPDAEIQLNEDSEIVHQAIQKLDPNFRSVVVLRFMEGYSTRETAEILNLPEGTVLSRLSRAQKKLKIYLAPYFGANHENKTIQSAAAVA